MFSPKSVVKTSLTLVVFIISPYLYQNENLKFRVRCLASILSKYWPHKFLDIFSFLMISDTCTLHFLGLLAVLIKIVGAKQVIHAFHMINIISSFNFPVLQYTQFTKNYCGLLHILRQCLYHIVSVLYLLGHINSAYGLLKTLLIQQIF